MTHPEVWLARHGETDWSATGRHTGRTNLPLNTNGQAAATRLQAVLDAQQFDAVFSSPLLRARQTCELAGFEGPVEIDDLQEWDYGDYEGVTTDQIRVDRPGWNVFVDGCPSGESAVDVGVRADRVIERLRSIDGRILVFGHGHNLRVLAARWIGLDPGAASHFLLGTATSSVLSWERETPAILRWNSG